MTVARYWAVGKTSEGEIDFTPAQMSQHLMRDWVPSLPPIGGHLLVGWPNLLTEPCPVGQSSFLSLKEQAGYTERQWKGFLSWMAGVCGARQVCSEEGYEWVAPASAFYKEAKKYVDPGTPPPGFLPSGLVIEPAPGNPARDRPDYIAVRGGNSPNRWGTALVEAKGTGRALQSLHVCPTAWATQVRNAVLTYRHIPMRPNRHLVVAVRSEPNAAWATTRRFQIRAWNSTQEGEGAPDSVYLDIASASLYGICRNLGLGDAASAISVGNAFRREQASGSTLARDWYRLAINMRDRLMRDLDTHRTRLRTLGGQYEVELEPETIEMISEFARPRPLGEIERRVIGARQRLRQRSAERPGGRERERAPSPIRIRRLE